MLTDGSGVAIVMSYGQPRSNLEPQEVYVEMKTSNWSGEKLLYIRIAHESMVIAPSGAIYTHDHKASYENAPALLLRIP